MGRTCDICGRGTAVANNVSHSNRKTKRVQKINLHNVRAVVNGKVRTLRVCSDCMHKIERPKLV